MTAIVDIGALSGALGSTGTKSINWAALSGETHKGALVLGSKAVLDGFEWTEFQHLIGVTDGTAERCAAIMNKHNVATTICQRGMWNDRLIASLAQSDPTSVDGSGAFDAWKAGGGIDIDVTDAFPTGGHLIGIGFGGSDVSAKAFDFTIASTVDTFEDVDCGFVPDVILLFGIRSTFTTTVYSAWSFGVVTRGAGTAIDFQGSHNYMGMNGSASSYSTGVTSDSYPWVNLSPVGMGPQVEVTAMLDGATQGFRAYTRGGSGGGRIVCGLALAFGGAMDYKAGMWEFPSSTGSAQEFTSVGFQPELFLPIITQNTNLDTFTSNGNAAALAIGAAMGPSEEWCHQAYDLFGGDPTDVGSLFRTKFVQSFQHDGSSGFDAELTSMIANGIELNVSATRGAGFEFPYLALASAAGPNRSVRVVAT